jgi:hypothetical protein
LEFVEDAMRGLYSMTELCQLAFACAVSSSAAQTSTAYRLSDGDTLRYTERTDGFVRIETPQGKIEVRTEHDAQLALTRGSPTSVNAWYEYVRCSCQPSL